MARASASRSAMPRTAWHATAAPAGLRAGPWTPASTPLRCDEVEERHMRPEQYTLCTLLQPLDMAGAHVAVVARTPASHPGPVTQANARAQRWARSSTGPENNPSARFPKAITASPVPSIRVRAGCQVPAGSLKYMTVTTRR